MFLSLLSLLPCSVHLPACLFVSLCLSASLCGLSVSTCLSVNVCLAACLSVCLLFCFSFCLCLSVVCYLFVSRSGTLKVGDRILAINKTNLRMHTLVDAVKLLQTAGDVVTLKICREPTIAPNSKEQSEEKYMKLLKSCGL